MTPDVKKKYDSYPEEKKCSMLKLREVVLNALKDGGHAVYEETLKWGEPSYIVNGGSTVRIDWKEKNPEYCCVFFHCQTCLVDTFKEVYGDVFQYQGNRTILLPILQEIPKELVECLKVAFNYHKIKHLPLLGL